MKNESETIGTLETSYGADVWLFCNTLNAWQGRVRKKIFSKNLTDNQIDELESILARAQNMITDLAIRIEKEVDCGE